MTGAGRLDSAARGRRSGSGAEGDSPCRCMAERKRPNGDALRVWRRLSEQRATEVEA